MPKEPGEINYCPSCGEGNVSIIGQAESGEWIMHCRDCNMDWAIRNVTGRLKIRIALEHLE